MSDDIRRRGLVADLGRRLAMRNLDELRVIDALLVRVEKGAAHYGPLDLSRPRDWQRERSEELLDALVYDVMGQLAARDRGDVQGDAQERLNPAQPTVGESIDRLRRAGWLERRKVDGAADLARQGRIDQTLRSNCDHLSSENASLSSQVEAMAMRIDSLAARLAAAGDVVKMARQLVSYEWEARLDNSKVSDDAKHDARELSYAIYEYDRTAKS